MRSPGAQSKGLRPGTGRSEPATATTTSPPDIHLARGRVAPRVALCAGHHRHRSATRAVVQPGVNRREHPIANSILVFAAHIFHESSTHWSVDDIEGGDELPRVERSQALRIIKEALTNARAHAEASEVIITLTGDSDGLEIAISDNGVAVDPESFISAPGHRGLATMRDRAAIIGGTCTIEPTSPHGCTVKIYVPRLQD